MKMHYYAYDYPLASWPTDDDPLHEYASREDFIEWMLNNRMWAKEGGDYVPSEKAVLRRFAKDDEAYIDLNGFCFVQSRLDREQVISAYFD